MNVYLAGARVRVTPTMSIGAGGEADVYDIGGGRALKVFKSPRHPDYAGAPTAQAAAQARLDAHQDKLPAFPTGLPERVVAPEELAYQRARDGRIVGYAMRLVGGADLLYRFAEPRVRRAGLPANRVVAVLRDLRATVAAVHAAGVVIGDFNDLNVLAAGDRAYLIDADSFQFGGHDCTVFCERFVDPLLCDADATAPVLAGRFGPASDWYAFAVIAMRSLLCVGPYGGVHKPEDASRRVPHARRPLRRVTVFDDEVVYPKPAIPYRLLPDELVEHFRRVFDRDLRVAFPSHLLDDLRWTRCRRCGAEHARDACPRCTRVAAARPVRAAVRGRVAALEVARPGGRIVAVALTSAGPTWLSWQGRTLRDVRGDVVADGIDLSPDMRFHIVRGGAAIARGGRVDIRARGAARVELADCRGGETAAAASPSGELYWCRGGQLYRDDRLGPAYVGDVLAGQTRIWAGDRLGLGFYRAGGVSVAFLFRAGRRGVDDRVELPAIRGNVIDVAAHLAGDRAWLTWREERAARTVARAVCVDQRGRLLGAATGDAAEPGWLASAHTGAAVGPYLFVATDAGVVRVEPDGGALAPSRTFPDTEPFVDAESRLLAGDAGLFVAGADHILRLTLS